jgi:hypothetical protein
MHIACKSNTMGPMIDLSAEALAQADGRYYFYLRNPETGASVQSGMNKTNS